MVSGVASPVTLNPLPTRVACVTLSAEVPELVMVTGCDLEVPLTMFPKLKLAGDTVIPGCTPVPERDKVVGEVGMSLTADRVLFVVTPDVGAYFTCSTADCPGFNVAGSTRPVTVMWLSATLICEMCTAAWPEFVKDAGKMALPPVTMFPKARLAGLNCNCPTAAVVPAPVRGRIIVGFSGSLLVRARLPESLPAALGEYMTLRAAV